MSAAHVWAQRWAVIAATSLLVSCAGGCGTTSSGDDTGTDGWHPPVDTGIDSVATRDDSVADRVDLSGPDESTELDAAREPLDERSIPDATADLADILADDAELAEAGLSDTATSADALDAPETRDIPTGDATDLRDGIAGDASTDGADTSDPNWQRYTWTPSTCAVERAVDAAAVVPPLRWRSCVDGRAGCQELVVDWGTATPSAERLMGGYPDWHDGTQGWLAVLQRLSPSQERLVISATDGPMVAAWRYPVGVTGPRCKVQAPTL